MWSEQKSPPRPLSQPLPSVDAFTHLTYGQKNALSGSIWFVCGFRVTVDCSAAWFPHLTIVLEIFHKSIY